jgi:colicin-like ribonuclease protein
VKFSNEAKLRSQMQKRGWTDQMILEALQTTGIPTKGKKGPATRYVHRKTGKSVIVDDASGEVFHIGGEGFKYD